MLDILHERGVEFDVIEYLKSPLDRATLEGILELIPDPPAALVRKDKRFKETGPFHAPLHFYWTSRWIVLPRRNNYIALLATRMERCTSFGSFL